MAISLFYIIAYALLCGAIFVYPKAKTAAGETPLKQNPFLWIVLALFIAECWASVAAGLLSLLHIPVTLISIGTAHLLAAALLFKLMHKRRIPMHDMFSFRKTDALVLLALLALIAVLGYIRFYTINPIVFATIDPAERLGNAMNIAVSKSVITHFPNQYFIQLTGSLFIQSLQPFAPAILPFRFFEWKDLLNLWFSGALFYGAVSLYTHGRFSKFISIIITFLFVFAYPWMNQLFGFVYPGVAVNLILLVIIAFALLYRGELDKRLAYGIVSIGCFGLGICYTLYVPPLFLAAFLAVFVYEKKICATSLPRIAITEIIVFIIPAVWTFANAVMLDPGGEYNVGNSIVNEGAIYRNLYSDFIPYAPLVFWLVWRMLSKKQFDFPLIFTLCFAAYQIGFFALMMTSRISTYYYYKLYFATWLIFLLLACLAINTLLKHARAKRFITMYMVCWALVAVLGVSGADYLINIHRPESNPQPAADVSFRVYSTNLLYFLHNGKYNIINYDWDFIELCTEARRLSGPVDEERRIEILTQDSQAVLLQDTFWKDALTSQLLIQPEPGEPENKAGLWIVLRDSQIYLADKDYYNSFKTLFENERGFIIDPADAALSS